MTTSLAAASWAQGRIPGAVHIPNAELEARIAGVAPAKDAAIVVYCWGPGATGASTARSAWRAWATRMLRELIGGFEYWAREGFATVSDADRGRLATDALTAPLA